MTEVVRPLEAINNLVYLALNDSDDPVKANLYMQMAKGQIALLNEITLSTLRFCDEQPKK
ncbi:hypothetical protein RBB79_17555 [Tunturiibacter empetritectus]|uniref:Uncharacterized protein n=1 Tax=Tunturiibacter lichenicola TaxID=2051959 RepID=A0A852VM04_9BACT|nr:hypothetical protein [Edaphobacter lichenicola]NYF91444.1 hypothetical protein [Edaphobacter lichenicola]